ncbi:MAG: (Fe-S)-binding protein [Syntrophobacteraceae bacterium]
MDDMKKLAALVKELEDQLMVCMRCGLCQSVCPVFAETGREADVARGKLALLDGLIRQMFKDPSGVNERLARCLLCGSCSASCPSGVKVLEIFLRARAILAGYMGLHPAKKILFRGMLAHPRLFDGLVQWGARLQGIFVKPADALLGTSCGRVFSPLAERHIKPLAPVPFHNMVKSIDTVGQSGLKVGFFVGCVADKVFPGVAEAVIRSLDHNKAGVFLPDNQGCCGIPALSSGDLESFRKLVRHNLDRFSNGSFDYLVTACATCTSTIKKLWPLFSNEFNEKDQARIRALADKTMDISQFLVDKMGVAPAVSADEDGKKILTYHDPCHLKKSLGVGSQPRALIRANPAYSFKEMAEADRCCGCGGSFNLQYYEISASIGRRKRDCIARSGCAVVATSCPACMLQISDMLSQAGDPILVKHAIEIYAESLD